MLLEQTEGWGRLLVETGGQLDAVLGRALLSAAATWTANTLRPHPSGAFYPLGVRGLALESGVDVYTGPQRKLLINL